ncbi:14706_t:CDS:2 [Racocetra persica]|uniref:14706_t:CDS:1 n=1 Tax=Racocetra persica TaxID=160502 RepID=A0ACA9MFK1_9GLOM|nr:14706_t:CDS:2 [Racocetra persica]
MILFVILNTGEKITFVVRINDTVESIKWRIQDLKEIPVKMQRLRYLTRELRNEAMPHGKKISLTVSECDTIESVKQKIHELEGIPINEQRLKYMTKELEHNEKKLTDYKIKDESTMYVTLRLRGGC